MCSLLDSWWYGRRGNQLASDLSSVTMHLHSSFCIKIRRSAAETALHSPSQHYAGSLSGSNKLRWQSGSFLSAKFNGSGIINKQRTIDFHLTTGCSRLCAAYVGNKTTCHWSNQLECSASEKMMFRSIFIMRRSLWAVLGVALRPSVSCLRFSRNRKAGETSNSVET